ncbi:MAG: glycosyltransferase, partial [Chloroflexota bacterium]|nr:glycosyltransferase [Chloroflexota bacterium]
IKYIGPVNMQEKIRLLSRAGGFLNPIEWEEPFGMVMIEAMALGCPVISFARGAAPEIVVHRKNGFLVHDVNEMVEFIPRIDEIDREVTRGYIERNFSARVMAEKYIKIYKKVIAASKKPPVRTFPDIPPNTSLLNPELAIRKVLPAQVPQAATAMVEADRVL